MDEFNETYPVSIRKIKRDLRALEASLDILQMEFTSHVKKELSKKGIDVSAEYEVHEKFYPNLERNKIVEKVDGKYYFNFLKNQEKESFDDDDSLWGLYEFLELKVLRLNDFLISVDNARIQYGMKGYGYE